MDGRSLHRAARRPRETRSTPPDRLPAGPRMFLTLSADGAELPEDQRSLPRKALFVIAAVVWLLAAPLYWAASAQGADQHAPHAVLVKSAGDDDDDDDRSESGDDDDTDESSVATTGTGAKDETTDDTTANDDPGTGRETRAANTDQPGLETGPSTVGETDAGDDTGKSEGNPTTGRETRAQNTDRRGLATGASTVGETDPGDDTGKTERR